MAIAPALFSFLTIIFLILVVPHLKVTTALDSIPQFRSITDGMTLVSGAGTFELGFFSPGKSNKRYLGIWYKNIPVQTIVWVANRANPINDTSGILAVNSSGNLVLSTQNGTVVWCTRLLKQAQKPTAKLLDTGNLVLLEENAALNPDDFLWQSFDYPTDELLPGMKFGWDLRKGLHRVLTAWKSPEDPSPGDFSWAMELRNYPESYLMKGTQKLYRSGPWNGMHPSGLPELKSNPIYDYNYVHNKDEIYYSFSLKNDSVFSRLVINETDHFRYRYVWDGTDQDWPIYATTPRDFCDTYALCGAYGNCMSMESPVCQCFEGFRPKTPQQWNSMNWSQGCVRSKPLSCKTNRNEDVFVKFFGLKVPETTHALMDETIGLEQCRERCLSNCSCMAYTNSDIRGAGSGCVMWFGDLIDIRQLDKGQDLYIRMAAPEIEAEYGHKKKQTMVVATVMVAISVVLLVGCYYVYKITGKMTEKSKDIEVDQSYLGREDDPDLPLFDLSTVVIATENFSIKNKIGEGGFGSVFRGRLLNGHEIAVKRLSRSSVQGMTEFKNEVKLLAKLQHRNIVKLLGCCIHGYEKMLVYEYMPHNSLDSFIFDQIKGKLLDWPKRFHIIHGTARGLLYLHEDSRLRIIHRDLKASNILLDQMLNPKISDFGMARTFEADQIEGNTSKVVGTYGYMAPEYASDGLFSIKSDVFSFGILMLEIISSQKSKGFFHPDYTVNLISHAWILWNKGKVLELIDDRIKNSCNPSEVMRCIHVSLLCVQQQPEHRPDMSSVVLMLRNEIELTEPRQPGFFSRLVPMDRRRWSSWISTNDVTVTVVEPR